MLIKTKSSPFIQFLALGLLLAQGTAAVAKDSNSGTITDPEKIEFLVYLHRHFPGLLAKRDGFYFEIPRLLNDQARLMAQLKELGVKDRTEGLRIELNAKPGQTLEVKRIDPGALFDWRQSLRKINSKLPQFESVTKDLEQMIIREIKKGGADSKKLHELLMFQIIFQKEGRVDLTGQEIANKIHPDTMGSDSLSYFSDIDTVVSKMNKFLEKLWDNHGQALDRSSIQGIHRLLNTFSNHLTLVRENVPTRLILQEVPPMVGIFRGCVGGDCATASSFPYSHDPNERTFFILDEAGSMMGYLTGTIVKSGGKTSFYAITISGPELNGADTTMLLQGLDRVKASLGVEQIVLPPDWWLGPLMNYPAVRDAYKTHVAGKTSEEIQYQGEQVRWAIEGFESLHNVGDYDKNWKNKEGVPLAIEPSRALKLEAVSAKVPFETFKPGMVENKPTRETVREIERHLQQGGRHADAVWFVRKTRNIK